MTTSLSPGQPDTAGPTRRPRTLLLVLTGSMLIDALEVSLVLPALPAIGRELGLSPVGAPWLLGGFAAGFAAMLLLGPGCTARWGRRRAYLVALAVFAAASVVGALTHSAALLIGTRVVKGACAALTAPLGMAIITTAFPEGPARRRAVSVYTLVGAAGFTVGLLLSGALGDWRAALLLPGPVALALLLPAHRVLPRDGAGPAPRPRPALLAHGPLLRSAIGAATLNGTHLSLMLVLVLHLQEGRGLSPWQCALALLPACLPLALAAPAGAGLVQRCGAPPLIALGAAAATTGYALLLVRGEPGGYLSGQFPTLTLVGLAFVLSFTALHLHGVSGLAADDRAAAVPLYQTGVQLGAVLLPTTTGALLAAGGHRSALYLITGAGATGLLVALAGLLPAFLSRAPRTRASGKER
ncbi:MFS transporter [Streptomyces sp. NPDC006235]|uniref:MFS transporter n=1 Tax=Streptomyces sp. NPDC006235 TaxID=3156736 RepID=UPI0033A47E95